MSVVMNENNKIQDVILISRSRYRDNRGYFNELSKQSCTFAEYSFVQTNHSRSLQGTLRGLHYQIGKPQGKLVHVITGRIFDVAVDLRPDSPTFGQWVGEYLCEERADSLWIPPGFAHGFYVLSPQADIIYECTAHYSQSDERAIRWDDPTLAIDWPLLENVPLRLSDKDYNAPLWDESAFDTNDDAK